MSSCPCLLAGSVTSRRELLRLGEDIPAGVALQWAARRTPELRPEARQPGFFARARMLARYAEIRVPTLAISFSDDAFATEAGASTFAGVLPGPRCGTRTHRTQVRPDSPKSDTSDFSGAMRRLDSGRWSLPISPTRPTRTRRVASIAADRPPKRAGLRETRSGPLAQPLRSPWCCLGLAVPPSGTRRPAPDSFHFCLCTNVGAQKCRSTATKLRRSQLRSHVSGGNDRRLRTIPSKWISGTGVEWKYPTYLVKSFPDS